MYRFFTAAISLSISMGCGDSADPSTPKGAFAMIAACIDDADRECLLRTLDQDSQWSVAAIHKTLAEIRRVAEKSYPEGERDNAFGAFDCEAGARTQEEMFSLFCKERRCLESVARGYGAVQSLRRTGDDSVELTTSRNAKFNMVRAGGRWGLAMLRDELRTRKLRAKDRLEQVRENARQYDEQRLAREGYEEGASPLTKSGRDPAKRK